MKKAKPDPQHREAAETLAAVADRLSARATSVTVPLYRVRRNEHPEAFASGILIAIEDARFLLSAGHIFDQPVKGEMLGVGLCGRIIIVQGVPRRLRSPRKSGRDHFDIATFALSGPDWRAMAIDHFLSIDEVTIDCAGVSKGAYAAIGYPVTKQPAVRTTNVVANAYRLAATGSSIDVYESLGYDQTINLLLGFDKRKIWGDGRLQTAPDPIGMSGGGVWSFGGHLGSAITPPLLIGIAIEWCDKTRHKVIVSTRMEQILLAIGHKHVDFQRAIGTRLTALRRAATGLQADKVPTSKV